MTIFSEHEGQLISEPAPELSTASSCSHFGQLKMISIMFEGLSDGIAIHRRPESKPGMNYVLELREICGLRLGMEYWM